MQNPFMESLKTAGAPGLRKLQELNEIGSRAARKLAEIQYQLVAIGIDGSVGQAKLLATAAGYVELMQAQSALAAEFGSRWMAAGRDAASVLAESRDEWMAWANQGMTAPVRPATVKPQGKAKGAARRPSTRKAA